MMTLRNFSWITAIFIISYHVLAVTILPYYLIWGEPTLAMTLLAVVFLYLTGLSITTGYHRYFSHRSYQTNKYVEAVLLFFGSMCAQGSALRWSNDHRIHHAFTDTDKDPYSIKHGFWHAHMGWLFHHQPPIDPKVVPDLLRNPRVMFQHNYYFLNLVVANGLAIWFAAWLLGDWTGALLLVGLLRLVFLHHFTWFINSLAHLWGEKPFSQELSAVDNYFLSLLTFGEGYHNYHHTFANDYRNGIKWYHFDPTKWLLWTLEKVGLVKKLKRTDPLALQKRLVLERKDLLLDRLKDVWYVRRDELEAQIHEIAESMMQHMISLKDLREKYRAFKAEHVDKADLKKLYAEIRELKKKVREDWKRWCVLSRGILHLRPLPQ